MSNSDNVSDNESDAREVNTDYPITKMDLLARLKYGEEPLCSPIYKTNNEHPIVQEFIQNTPIGWVDYRDELLHPIRTAVQRIINHYPMVNDVFNAFHLTPAKAVRVVIVGQDPYHNGTANGLSFSANHGSGIPPTLRKIYDELAREGYSVAEHGNLAYWAQQGVLMLNSALTVEPKRAGSHINYWKPFYIAVIRILRVVNPHCIFMLWGAKARAITKEAEFKFPNVLIASHPSPINQTGTFYGCDHFNKANEILRRRGLPLIDWNLS